MLKMASEVGDDFGRQWMIEEAKSLESETKRGLQVASGLGVDETARLSAIKVIDGERNGVGGIEDRSVVVGAAGKVVLGVKAVVPVAVTASVEARGSAVASAVHDVAARYGCHKVPFHVRKIKVKNKSGGQECPPHTQTATDQIFS